MIEKHLSQTADDGVRTYGLALLSAQEKRDVRTLAFLKNYVEAKVELASPNKLNRYVQKNLVLPGNISQSPCTVDPTRYVMKTNAMLYLPVTSFGPCSRVSNWLP